MTRAPAEEAPDAGARPRVYYGWVMVVVAILMALASMPGQTVLMGLFNDPIREDLGLGLKELSGSYTVATIAAAVFLPFIGRAADRFGLRVVIGLVAVGFAGGLALVSAAGGLLTLTAGFFLARLLGQGSMGMLANHTTAMWFERRLGVVHAVLVLCGFSLGSALTPKPTGLLIEAIGWRESLLVLAGGVLVLVLPAVLTVYRNRPEDIGQHLDGDPAPHEPHHVWATKTDAGHDDPAPAGDPAFTVREALATRAYWILVANQTASGVIGTALLFHMQPMLRAAGQEGSPEQSAEAVMGWAVAFGLSTPLIGWLVDRVRPRHLLPFAPVLIGLGCLLVLAALAGWTPAGVGVVPAVVAGMFTFGVGQSVSFGVSGPAMARYYGRTHHGAIRGVSSTAMVAGTGAGPLLAGWAAEAAGTPADPVFAPVLMGFAAASVPLVLVALLLRPPTPPRRIVGGASESG